METRNKKGQFIKGLEPWNKDSKGVMKPNKTSFKKGHGKVDLNIRFWNKVDKVNGGVLGHWNWIAGVNKAGYGRVNINRKAILAHRVSYEMKFGKIPKNLHVLHKCDYPPCVNPDHLFLGTQNDNNHDRDLKGRAVLGEDRSQSKLTMKKANQIRELYKTGKYSHRSLGKKFNISSAIIFHVIHNHAWRVK